MGGDKSVLVLKRISKSFKDHQVLDNISLDVKSGEIFGIVGGSGSGKSTLLKIITGNVLPEGGEILFEPKDKAGYSVIEPVHKLQAIFKNIKDLKRTVGYSPQTPSFYEKLTCAENIDCFGSLYDLPSDALKANTKTLLKLVGLEEWGGKLAKDLSGGMRKRLDLACTLVHDPKILILDEPTSDIDFILRDQMWDLIKQIRAKGTTVIMSSHFIEEIEGLCDRVAIINNSQIEFLGSPHDLKKKDGAGLVIKLKTREKNYVSLKKKLNSKYGSKKISLNSKEKSGYFLLMLKGLKDPDKEVPKILQLIKSSRQNLVEFNYSKEGISDVFLELHEKAMSAPKSKPTKSPSAKRGKGDEFVRLKPKEVKQMSPADQKAYFVKLKAWKKAEKVKKVEERKARKAEKREAKLKAIAERKKAKNKRNSSKPVKSKVKFSAKSSVKKKAPAKKKVTKRKVAKNTPVKRKAPIKRKAVKKKTPSKKKAVSKKKTVKKKASGKKPVRKSSPKKKSRRARK